MDRLEVLLAQIPMFDATMRDFITKRAASMDEAGRAEYIATLASYVEEREQLETEYREHKRLLDGELRAGLNRLGGAVHDLEKSINVFAQSLEQDPEELIAS